MAQELTRRLSASYKTFADYDEICTLASDLEDEARRLSGLPSGPVSDPGGDSTLDLLAVLRTTRLLLHRAADRDIEQQEFRGDTSDEQEVEPLEQERQEGDNEPPPATDKIIALRDMVLLAASGGGGDQGTLRTVYSKLGRILAEQEVQPIESEGEPLDWRRQEIVDTRPTDDAARDEVVCETVRPGYEFRERVVRPQQVVVWRFENEALVPETTS